MKIQVKKIEELNKYTNDISILREFIKSSEDIRNKVIDYYEMLDKSSYPNKPDDIDNFIHHYMEMCNNYQEFKGESNIFDIYNEIISSAFSKTHDAKKIIDISNSFEEAAFDSRQDLDDDDNIGKLLRKVYLKIIENIPYNLDNQEFIICSHIVTKMVGAIYADNRFDASTLIYIDDYYDDLITYLKSVTISNGKELELDVLAIDKIISMSIDYGISYYFGSNCISAVMRSICLSPEVAKKTNPQDNFRVVNTMVNVIKEMDPADKLYRTYLFHLITPYSQYPHSTVKYLKEQFPSFSAIDINQSPLLRVYNADFKTSNSHDNANTIISNINRYIDMYEHILSGVPAHMQVEYVFMVTESLITALQENKGNIINKNSCEELTSLSSEEVAPFYAKLLEAPCNMLIDINKAIINDRDFNAAMRLLKYGTLQTTADLLKKCTSIDEYLSIISAVNIKPNEYIDDDNPDKNKLIDIKSLSLVKPEKKVNKKEDKK